LGLRVNAGQDHDPISGGIRKQACSQPSGLKPNTGKIKTIEDANLALKEIGMLEHELAAIDAEADRQIAEINSPAPGGRGVLFSSGG
jgi:hypothetical protein